MATLKMCYFYVCIEHICDAYKCLVMNICVSIECDMEKMITSELI